jgi:hypothetical protein
MPIIYLHVGEMRGLVWLLGGATIYATGMDSAAAMVWMTVLVSATYLVPHHADAFKLAERSGLGTARWAVLGVLAVAVGLVLVNLTHLPAFYEDGANNIVGLGRANWSATTVMGPVQQERPPDSFKLKMAGTGFVTAAGLTYLRRMPWFPLHPVGYLVACAIGYRIWAPIMAIWFIKWVILRYLGGRVYKRARYFFLGLVMTHFLVASVWGVLAAFDWGPTQRFFIGFW